MATLVISAGGSNANAVIFTPVSSALANLSNGAGTIAILMNMATISGQPAQDFVGLTAPASASSWTAWYHTLAWKSVGGIGMADDDGQVGGNTTGGPNSGNWGTDWYICSVAWPSTPTGSMNELWSWSSATTPSWTHQNSNQLNGANRAGPSPSAAKLSIGYAGDDFTATFSAAVVGIWAGTQLTNLQVEALVTNKRTSDWWNNAAGHPTFLSELTSITPTDIGANPSTFSTLFGGASAPSLTGANPPGWTFDGHGAAGVAANLAIPPLITAVRPGY